MTSPLEEFVLTELIPHLEYDTVQMLGDNYRLKLLNYPKSWPSIREENIKLDEENGILYIQIGLIDGRKEKHLRRIQILGKLDRARVQLASVNQSQRAYGLTLAEDTKNLQKAKRAVIKLRRNNEKKGYPLATNTTEI